MKIVSFNVNGVRSAYRKGFSEWMLKENPDIVCLQEIKSGEVPSTGDLFSPDLSTIYHISINPAKKKGYSGVLVYSKAKPTNISKELGLERFDNEGRILAVEFDNLTLVNLYIPHGGRKKENLGYKLDSYDRLVGRLSKIKDKNVILTGDFNVAHKEIDLARPEQNRNNIMFTPEERLKLDTIVNLGFIDSFREFNKDGGNYTWWPYLKSARDENIGWRLDYIFASKPLTSKLKSAFILKEIFLSDHCPMGIEINL